LAGSRSAAETDAIYVRSCVPRKARLDLIYQARRTLCLDMSIMLKTVFRRLR
jgi:lipopolysaccharide/colanic/teichoic acid biosynthesis glycosyltransferase